MSRTPAAAPATIATLASAFHRNAPVVALPAAPAEVAAEVPRAPQRAREHGGRRGGRERRGQRPQLLASGRDAGGEQLARGAGAQMGPQPAPAQHPSVTVGDSPAHLLTAHFAPLLDLRQPLARLEDRLLGGGGGGAQRDPDLLVGEPAELAQEQRRALALGQPGEILDQAAPAGAAVHRLLDRARQRHLLAQRLRLALAPAPPQQRDRLVVGDPVQPGPQRRRAPLLAKRGQRSGERRLQRVLRVLVVAENRAAVAVQRLVVALVDDRERALAAPGGLPRQQLVAEVRQA